MIDQVLEESRRRQFSRSIGCSPPPPIWTRCWPKAFFHRLGCQFHWRNRGYRDFQDFLDTFTAKRRKNINRERRLVRDAGLELRLLSGHEATEAEWRILHDFYRSTFDRLGGTPTLTLPFSRDRHHAGRPDRSGIGPFPRPRSRRRHQFSRRHHALRPPLGLPGRL